MSRRIPGPFVALLVTTVLVQVLSLDVETIGSRYGAIPSSIPAPSLPRIELALLPTLVGPAFTIALYATDPNSVRRRQVPKGVEVYEINGPFFWVRRRASASRSSR